MGLASIAGAAPSLKVRSLADPEASKTTTPTTAPTLDPRWAKIQAERDRRWREFDDDLMRGDRSSHASRRADWQATTSHRWPQRGMPETALGPGPVELARVAFIRVDFENDRDGGKSTGNGRFDLSGPDTTGIPIDRPPHNRTFYLSHFEAFKRYYETQSYGRVAIEGDVWPRDQDEAYTVSDMADFGPWEFSQDIYGAAVQMFRTMLFAADSQSIVFNDRIPWDTYDRVVIIHAGSDLQSDVRRDSPHDIPSFTIGVSDSDGVVFPATYTPVRTDSINRGRPIEHGAFIPETGSQDGYYAALNGVIAHECGHLLFGFFDLYDIVTGLPVVGFWSLMDSGNGVGSIVTLPDSTELFATGLLPPSLDPWHKFRFLLLDQLPVPEVDLLNTMALRSSQRYPDLRRVTLSSDEYLMIENRYQAPADSVELDQDPVTRVVLGPKNPDRYEYDALLIGGGMLVWHIDESVLPNEYVLPCDSTRANPECGINAAFGRKAVSIIEADGLADLGDPGSPYIFGAPFDPFFKSNNPTLSDFTVPNLRPHIGTYPHVRLDFIDDPDSTMHMTASRSWELPGWPIAGDFPPGGPILLAADLDGDGAQDICWAGGDSLVGSPAAIYAARVDGVGLYNASNLLGGLDGPALPVVAAFELDEPVFAPGGAPEDSIYSYVAATTAIDTSSQSGRVWLFECLRDRARVAAGWPVSLPAKVTTPPVITRDGIVYVGCADGRVRSLDLAGTLRMTSGPPLGGPITGRLAVMWNGATMSAGPILAGGGPGDLDLVAAGSANGEIATFPGSPAFGPGWSKQVGGPGFEPDFLWLDFGGANHPAQDCFAGRLSLVAHHADRLWAFCMSTGELLPGWGRQFSDTLVNALGAGDPDGDGFPEVLIQTVGSKVAFINSSGYPSPGWPKPGSTEHFRTGSPPLAMDLDGDRKSEVVAMNASGIVAALKLDGRQPEGWPLATGLAATGSPVIADLEGDGTLDLIAPDDRGVLYGYRIAGPLPDPRLPSWPMLGGDPGRTSALHVDATSTVPGPSPGPLVSGSLKVFPNPARRKPVSFAYQLTEPADVEFRILDTSGHEVASFTRRGRQSDNLEVWEPGAVPAGLYVARLKFRGPGTERIETVTVGVLR